VIPKSYLTQELAERLAGVIADRLMRELEEPPEAVAQAREERMAWEQRVWEEFIEKAADPGERKFKAALLKLFSGIEKEVLSNMPGGKGLEKADEADIEHWMFGKSKWEKRFQQEGLDLIEGLAVVNGNRVLSDIPVVGVGFDVTNPAVAGLLEERSIKFAKEVIGTTETQIRRMFAEGISAGEGIPALRNRIRQYFETDTIPKRAEMIARTETIWASNAGAEQAYIQSGVVEGKEWLIAGDERTCPFCRKADEEFGEGNAIPLGEPFFDLGHDVTGVDEEGQRRTMKLTYEDVRHPPLHPRCRCSIVPKIMKEA